MWLVIKDNAKETSGVMYIRKINFQKTDNVKSVSKLGWIEDVEIRLKHLLMSFPNINNIN